MDGAHGLSVLRLATLVALLGVPARAAATCVGIEGPRWVAHHDTVALLNPLGAENNLRVGLCIPLYHDADDVFSANHVEFGATTYVSPVYAIGGAYAQISPATFYYARVELEGVGMWPIPLDAAGYFPRSGYTDSFRESALPQANAQSAGGWAFRGISVLRGRLELGHGVSLSALDGTIADYAELGDAPFYVSMRLDLIVARKDWVLSNEATVLVGIAIDHGPELRFGPYDALRDVPAAGYFANQIGGMVTADWKRPFEGISELEIYWRVGYYTDHAIRADEATTLLGVSLDHDLGGL